MYATLDEEKSVDYLSEDIEASKEFVDVYFARSDDQLQKAHKYNQVCHFRKKVLPQNLHVNVGQSREHSSLLVNAYSEMIQYSKDWFKVSLCSRFQCSGLTEQLLQNDTRLPYLHETQHA